MVRHERRQSGAIDHLLVALCVAVVIGAVVSVTERAAAARDRGERDTDVVSGARIAIERMFGMPVESAPRAPGAGGDRGGGDRRDGDGATGTRAPGDSSRAPVDPTIRKFRFWIRGIHTGQAGGFIGETIAAIASLAAAGLVLTGLSLTIRRFWRKFGPASATAA